MFKWGLFKKELQETHLPEDIREQMESIYSQFSGTDRVVLVMDQLTQIIRDQNKKLEELEKTSRKRQFQVERADKERNFQADLITSLSDEIQGPLNTINQLGDWLDQTHLQPEQRAGLAIYRLTARKLRNLFANIIDVARLREGVLDLDPIPFNLEELVQDSVNAFRLTAQDKGIGLKVHMDESIPKPLVGDLRRLEQILISLVNNAIKFTYEGEVQIQVRHGGEDGPQCIVHFLVMDSGIGFPEDRKELIFERMAQGDPDIERNYGGTGLGLYVCKCLVELMGGKIWAENRESGGATFGFSLPFEMGSVEDLKEELIFTPREKPENESPADADEKGDGLSREPEDNGASGYSEGESMNILVVDDCEDTRKLIGKFMEDIPCQIYFAGNGLEALEKHDEHQYDLILMDIQMPEMDGVGATIEIRKKEVAKKVGKTPIIAMVGNPGVQDEGYYLAADFDRCLIKPVSKADLIEIVSSYLCLK